MEDQKNTTDYDELRKIHSESGYGSINNDERYNNAEILRLFLEEGGKIRMFCGEMSTFRKSFYTHITEERCAEAANKIKEIIECQLTNFSKIRETALRSYWQNRFDFQN